MANELQSVLKECFVRQGIQKDDPIALAFSGGSDSLALLSVLASLRPATSLKAFYVQHHLRSEAELAQEIAANQSVAQQLGVPFVVLDLGAGTVAALAKQRGRGEEEAARILRYEALERACKEANIRYLCTAHNSDDQLETLLMRIGQGGSVRSLAGMVEGRAYRSVLLVRPFLTISHRRLEEYLETVGLVGSVDSTNRDPRYLRNAIRHQVKGPLLSLFPHAREHASTVMRRLRYASALLEAELLRLRERDVTTEVEGFSFSASWFTSLDPNLAELLLFQLVGELIGTEERINFSTIERLTADLWRAAAGDRIVARFASLILSASGDRCLLSSEVLQSSYLFRLQGPAKEQTIDLGGGLSFIVESVQRAQRDSQRLLIAALALQDPIIRSPMRGDTIALAGGSMSVAKLLSQMKIPPYLRPSVPLLVDRSGVVAVFGASSGGSDRLAQRFKAPLAHDFTNIYSSRRRNNNSEL